MEVVKKPSTTIDGLVYEWNGNGECMPYDKQRKSYLFKAFIINGAQMNPEHTYTLFVNSVFGQQFNPIDQWTLDSYEQAVQKLEEHTDRVCMYLRNKYGSKQ